MKRKTEDSSATPVAKKSKSVAAVAPAPAPPVEERIA
jgi:hypothetical protein